MKILHMIVTTLSGLFLNMPAIAADYWKAEAKKWELMAKSYEVRYGWINDQFD